MFKDNDKYCDFPQCTNHALFYGFHDIKKETIDLCGVHYAAYAKAIHTGTIGQPELVCSRCGAVVKMIPGLFNQISGLLDNRDHHRCPKPHTLMDGCMNPFFICCRCNIRSGSWATLSCGKVVLADYSKPRSEVMA